MRKTLNLLLSIPIAVCTAAVQAATFPEKPQDENFFADEGNLIRPEHYREINSTSAALSEGNVPLRAVTIRGLASHDADGTVFENAASSNRHEILLEHPPRDRVKFGQYLGVARLWRGDQCSIERRLAAARAGPRAVTMDMGHGRLDQRACIVRVGQ